MATKALRGEGGVPAGMLRVCRRFELWRKSHKARLPIPERLWAAAAQAAREHGVFRTAKVLRLEYGKLKRMVEAASSSPKRTTVHPLGQQSASLHMLLLWLVFTQQPPDSHHFARMTPSARTLAPGSCVSAVPFKGPS